MESLSDLMVLPTRHRDYNCLVELGADIGVKIRERDEIHDTRVLFITCVFC